MRGSWGRHLVVALTSACSPQLEAPDATFRSDVPDSGACETKAGAGPPRVLVSPDVRTDAWLGDTGAIRGDELVVVAPNVTASASSVSLYAAVPDVGASSRLAELTAIGTGPGEAVLPTGRVPYFGTGAFDISGVSVAVGADVIAVGVAGSDGAGGEADVGRVEVYRRVASEWTHSQTITAPRSQPCALFGFRVVLAGDALVIGAPRESRDLVSSCDGPIEVGSGAVHVFRDDVTGYVWDATLYGESDNGGGFGASLAFGGGRLAVGAPFEPVGSDALRIGAAYVFVDDGGLRREARLSVTGSRPGALFGAAVGLESDVLVVAAPLDDSCHGRAPFGQGGRAYGYVRGESGWEARQCLHADEPAELDLFGWAVSVTEGRLLVGAPFESGGDGAAWSYVRQGSGFDCAVRLEAPPSTFGGGPVFADAAFGTWVGVSGSSLVVGAPWAEVDGMSRAGSVYVFPDFR